MSETNNSTRDSVKNVLRGLTAAHANMIILETVRIALEDGYCGDTGTERSEVFQRKVYALIQAEQHRLLGVLDRHIAKVMKAVQHE